MARLLVITRISSAHEPTSQLPGGSRDSVRRQHGGHACGVAKQIVSFVRLTLPETSIPRAEPGRFFRTVSRMDGGNKLQFPSLPVTKEELLVSLLAAC